MCISFSRNYPNDKYSGDYSQFTKINRTQRQSSQLHKIQKVFLFRYWLSLFSFNNRDCLPDCEASCLSIPTINDFILHRWFLLNAIGHLFNQTDAFEC